MINNIEYYPYKKTCYQDAFCYCLFTCVGIWLCVTFGSASPSEIMSSGVAGIRWIFKLFGQTGLIVFLSIITFVFGMVCFLNINAIIRCTIVTRRYLPSDWEERKAIVKKESMAFPMEINQSMLKQIMIVVDLPQQQVEAVMRNKHFIPEGIIVFPDIKCFTYVPVYFNPDNYYVYKTDQTIVFSLMDNKKLTSYKVDQSDVDYVNKCEQLADDIRKHPDKYHDALIEDFKPPVYEKHLSNNK